MVISGLFFVRSIVEPVKRLNDAARNIAAGNFSQRVELPNRYDELAELSESINYMTAEIDKTSKMKNDFISTVSHELRTPLTAINRFVEQQDTILAYDALHHNSRTYAASDESQSTTKSYSRSYSHRSYNSNSQKNYANAGRYSSNNSQKSYTNNGQYNSYKSASSTSRYGRSSRSSSYGSRSNSYGSRSKKGRRG